MFKLENVIYCAAVVAMGSLLSVCLPSSAPTKNVRDPRHGAIIRLYTPATDEGPGRFFCSGTVINDQYIVTAAHCVVRLEPFTPVEIRDNSGIAIGSFALVGPVNQRGDVALLVGDFRTFQRIKLSHGAANTMNHFLDNARKMQACGYPWGAELTCVVVTDRVYSFNSDVGTMGVKAKGWLFPGMSGGPVIDLATGEIVGVNTAAGTESIVLSPVVGLGAMFDINEDNL